MREGRKKQDQTNKAKQHSTPKAVKKNELPRVGLEPTTLMYVQCAMSCIIYMYLYIICSVQQEYNYSVVYQLLYIVVFVVL